MKTKIIFLFLVNSFLTMKLFSQATFGIRGGINFYNITGKDANGDKLDNKIKTGFNAGVNAEIPIGIDFYIQPGLLFSTKGSKSSGSKVDLSYVELPVNLLYKPELGKGKLILGFGPYAALAVSGQYENGLGGETGIKFKSKVTATDPPGFYLKRFDAGANLLFGYEMASRLSVQLNAALGLVNISPEYEGVTGDESSFKNTGFGVSLGYRFGK